MDISQSRQLRILILELEQISISQHKKLYTLQDQQNRLTKDNVHDFSKYIERKQLLCNHLLKQLRELRNQEQI